MQVRNNHGHNMTAPMRLSYYPASRLSSFETFASRRRIISLKLKGTMALVGIL